MAPHSSTLAWKIPWMEEAGRLQFKVGHNWGTALSLFTFMHWRRKWQPTPVFLPGEPQGRWSLVGCCLWGREELGMAERLHFHFHFLHLRKSCGKSLFFSHHTGEACNVDFLITQNEESEGSHHITESPDQPSLMSVLPLDLILNNKPSKCAYSSCWLLFVSFLCICFFVCLSLFPLAWHSVCTVSLVFYFSFPADTNFNSFST